MKKFVVFCLALPLLFAGVSSVHAQCDSVKVYPQHDDQNSSCGFNLFVSNHNSAGKNIDEIKLEITSGNGIIFDQLVTPNTHWTVPSTTDLVVNTIADNTGIAPGATLGGFIFSYVDNQFDDPVSITWTTRNSGADICSGTITTICTQFQSFKQIDTATKAVEQSTEALRLARLRLSAGVGTQLEVIRAEDDLTRADVNRLQAIIGFNQSISDLQRAVNGL